MVDKRSLLDEWNPNPYFIILSLIFYVMAIYFAGKWIGLLILGGFLCMGWAFSFARLKKKEAGK